MTFVLDVINCFIWSKSMVLVEESISANTGVPPKSIIGFTEAMNVAEGTITSSPGPIPRAFNAIRMADVPELALMPCLA